MSQDWVLRKGDTFDPRLLVWVEDNKALKRLHSDIQRAEFIAFDTETTGLYEHATTGGPVNGGIAARLVMMTLTMCLGEDGEPTTYVIPLSHPSGSFVGSWRKVSRIVANWLKPKKLWAHHAKFDCRYIYALTGVDLSGSIHWDTMASCALLDENSTSRLKPRAAELFDIDEWYDAPLNKPGAAEHVPYYDLSIYAARDTYWTYRMAQAHRRIMWLDYFDEGDSPFYYGADEVLNANLGELAMRVTMPTVRTLSAVEQRGVRLDVEKTGQRLSDSLKTSEELRQKIARRYEEDGLSAEGASLAPTSKWFKAFTKKAVEKGDLEIVSMTPNGAPQWNAAVLEKLERKGSELAGTILAQRDAEKQAQFLQSWLDKAQDSGDIHAWYHVGRTVTGRLSCVSPDTLIDMPRDMSKYPHGVPISEVEVGDYVYSFDHHMSLTLRQVSWVGPTKTAPTIIVTFENSEGEQTKLTVTEDHLVRLYSGDYRHASYLMRGGKSPRVLGMVRRAMKGYTGSDHYLKFFPESNARQERPDVGLVRNGSLGGGRAMEHRWVTEQVLGRPLESKYDVNHIDGNKVNNHPSNLEYILGWKHRRNTHKDGTRGKAQPGTTTHMGRTDWRPVKIEEGPVMEVWDMSIPFDHCFVANGIVVHNSSDPNMQQVSGKLKSSFVPRPGHVFAEIDYSQVELRVAAMISECFPMIEAFQRGDDLHRLLGARLAKRDRLEDVTKEDRQKAKSANFGLLYGMNPEGFQTYAETAYGVEMSLQEAYDVHHQFFDMWVGLTEWHERARTFARRSGYAVSPIGRVRRLPDIWSNNPSRRSAAERQAINAPVQGMGSDIMQMAAASIEGTLRGHSRVDGVQIVATVHDSIELELAEDRWESLMRECLYRMTEAIIPELEALGMRVTVPLEAEATVGRWWGDSSLGVFESK